MKTSALLRLEHRIRASDGNGITWRWHYGRRLLADRKLTTENGHLRHGAAAGLIRDAQTAGLKLSERELRRRVQAARTYRDEAEIGHIRGRFRTWRDLCEAGFPPAEGTGETPEPSLSDDDNDPQPTLSDELFPPLVPVGGTRRFARRDQERDARIAELLAAVDGNWDATHSEAVAALGRAA